MAPCQAFKRDKVVDDLCEGPKKVKGPELGISGPALRGDGGGRGLAAKDAVCLLVLYYQFKV